jgi:hypothetical protein
MGTPDGIPIEETNVYEADASLLAKEWLRNTSNFTRNRNKPEDDLVAKEHLGIQSQNKQHGFVIKKFANDSGKRTFIMIITGKSKQNTENQPLTNTNIDRDL